MFIAAAVKGIADAFNKSSTAGMNLMQYSQYGHPMYESVQRGIRANENAQAGLSQFSNLTASAHANAVNNTAGMYGLGSSELRGQLLESIDAARNERAAALNTNAVRINSQVGQQINNATNANAESQVKYQSGMTIAQSMFGVAGSVGMLIFAATKGGKPENLQSGNNNITPTLSNVNVNMNTGYSGGSRANVTSVGTTNTLNSEIGRANATINEAYNTSLNTQIYGQSGETFDAHGSGTVLTTPPRYSTLQVQEYLSQHGQSMMTSPATTTAWASEHGQDFSHFNDLSEPVPSTSTGGITKASVVKGPEPFTSAGKAAVESHPDFLNVPDSMSSETQKQSDEPTASTSQTQPEEQPEPSIS